MRRLLFIVAACLCGGVAIAQVNVYSPRADATSVTIYRDGLALITETRVVELPAEPVTLVFQGVVDSLLPQSAVMSGADRALASTDFSFDQLTPASLLKRSVGKTVTLVRTNRQTGRVTRTDVTVVSAGDGVILRAADGSEALRCSGVPEHLELAELPSESNTKPMLSVRLAGGAPGRREIRLSYLAHGFSWSSDYVARLNEAADRLDLTGWVTLENRTASSFHDAQVQVVAGRLNLLSEEDGGSASNGNDSAEHQAYLANHEVSLLSQCFPLGTTTTGLPSGLPRRAREARNFQANSPIAMVGDLENIVVTGSRRAVRESLGDYQLYRLPLPTDLNAQQTKQVVFLSQPAVKVERFYSVRVPALDAQEIDPDGMPNLVLRWENEEKNGLGEPLPSGAVRVFEPRGETEIFTGEASIEDTAVGLPNELTIARALGLTSEYTLETEDIRRSRRPARLTVNVLHEFSNNKDAPVIVEVRHAGGDGYSSPVVRKSTLRAGKKYGDLAWRFVIPAGGHESLRYQLRATELP